MTRFKVGDRVICRTPTIVCEEFKDKVGIIESCLTHFEGQEVFDIKYDCGTRQVAYSSQDGVELLTTPFTPKNIEELSDPDGGPAEYYDFPQGAITLNDLIEFKSMGFHRGNIFKACWRWGEKSGVTKEYDARKIIYSGARLLKQLVGVKELRKTLQKMLDDPQFKEENNE